jgi:rifampicin phosphotransferase
LDRLIVRHTDLFWYTFLGQLAMMVRMQMLARWVKRRTRGLAPSDLVRGLVGLKALAPNAELRQLACQARDLPPDVLAALAASNKAPQPELLAASHAGQELLAGMDAFLSRYGHLSSNGMDFSEVPWAENPSLIWSAIGREVRSPVHMHGLNIALIRDTARQQARQQLHRGERPLFDRLLDSTVTYIGIREHLSDRLSHDAYQMRRLVLALAEQLVSCRRLHQLEDIFYLTYDEVRDLAAGRPAGQAAQELVAVRRAEMAVDADMDLPATLCGDHVPAVSARLTEGKPYLSGIAGSSGRAQGYARVVMDPARAPVDLSAADILVVPFTDVGWTPLFPGVSGIVAETGGQLSHTSIVAREYGLPAVVNVRQATLRIRDGQPITVDGDQGRVYLQHLEQSR